MKLFNPLIFSESLLSDSTYPRYRAIVEKFVENFNLCVKGEFEFLPSQQYTAVHAKYKLRHTCGEVVEMSMTNLLDISRQQVKTGCKTCKIKEVHDAQRDSVSSFYEKFKKKHSHATEFRILGEYKDSNTKIKVVHKCGYEFDVRPRELIMGNYCPQCSKETQANNQRYTHSEFLESFEKKSIYNKEYEFLSEYVSTHEKLKVRHTKCDKIFEMRPRELISGNYCPYCSNSRSKAEKEVFEYIKSILPKDTTVEENVRGLLKSPKLELDIYIPSMKIAIEYNGIWWHREELVKDRSYKKVLEANDNGIRLVTVMEHDWLNKKELLKEKLAYILGVSTSRKIYARKTAVYELASDVKNGFLEANHIQGKDKSFINLGLYENDTLVSVLTITKPRKSLNAKSYEISRYATLGGTSVIGGFSKLLSYVSNYLPKGTEITTYASLGYSQGDLYINNGFEFSHISKPSYWYYKKNSIRLYHRFTFNKKEIERMHRIGKLKFFDAALTEKENMKRNDYFSILDCGNLVFKKIL